MSPLIRCSVILGACSLIVSPIDAHTAAAQARDSLEVEIGIVLDGPWERNEELLPLFRGEIEELVRDDFGAGVPLDRVLVGDWTADGVRAAVDRLLADPGVDVVIGLGVLASHELAQRRDLPKPCLAAVILDPDLQGLPNADGRSGVPNLNYLAIPLAFEEDVRAFLDIVSFDRLAVVLSGSVGEAIPVLGAGIPAAAAALGLEVTVILARSGQDALARIPAEAEAVYLAPLHSWAPGGVDELISGLIERRLPSFARIDERDVERGLLATRTPDEFFDRLARRLALNVQSVLLDQDPGELRTAFSVPARLIINMATARAIGTYPPWRVLTEAVLLNERPSEVARTLTLRDAVREAVQVNLDLAARERFVAAGAQEVARSRSRLLPQVEVSTLGTLIDQDRAEASFGQQSETMLSGSATLTQLLFSERAWTDLSVQRSLQTSREYERDALALDISLEASNAYLNVLRAKTFERIRQENLRLTRTNLEDAQLRVRIGTARPTEVLRWESQLAVDRQEVIGATADRNRAEIALNRILHRPLEERFETVETHVTDPDVQLAPRVYPYMDDPWSFRVFRAFMSQEALANAPELRGFDAAIDAQNRVLRAARRTYWLPTVAVQAGITSVFGRGGAGSEGFGGGPALDSLGFAFAEVDDLSWNVGLTASIPLFEGGKRPADTRQALRELERLQLERAAVAERIEQRIRSALHVAAASYAKIDLARAAAGAARRNFELVSDAYAQGATTVLDVLDAQNAFLVAELAAANSVFDFLLDFMEVNRANSQFVFFGSPEETEAFIDRLERFMAENQP